MSLIRILYCSILRTFSEFSSFIRGNMKENETKDLMKRKISYSDKIGVTYHDFDGRTWFIHKQLLVI